MTPTPRTDEVRGNLARYNVHGSMSIAYTEMGKWADKLERELEETKAQLKAASESTHWQAICIHNCAAHIGPGTETTLDGLPMAVKRVVRDLTSHKAALEKVRVALRPLAKIADAWNDDGLDESRPYWGHTKENAASIEIVSGRGGKQLLTIGDSFIADEALTAINELNKLQQPTLL